MKKQTRIDKIGITKNQIKTLLKNKKRSDIAKDLKISNRTLDRIIKDNNLNRKNFGPKYLSQEKIQEIKNYYKNNKKQKEIAEQFGVTQSTISKIINNHYRKSSNINLTGQAKVRMDFKNGN